MGASGWHYFAPYQSDIGKVLQLLRRRVFDNQEYLQPQINEAVYDAHLANLPPEHRAQQQQLMEMAVIMDRLQRDMMGTGALDGDALAVELTELLDGMQDSSGLNPEKLQKLKELLAKHDPGPKKRRKQPKSIEALLEQCAEAGTHSILDIDRITEAPDFGAAAPMHDSMVIELYGTSKPTRADIEAHHGAATEEMARWQAYYTLVYKDDQPVEIYFEGVSGD